MKLVNTKNRPLSDPFQEIATILHIPDTIIDLAPDLVDVTHEEIYEIKPFGVGNLAFGIATLQSYIQVFNWAEEYYFHKKGNWHAGTGKYYTPPVSFEIMSPVPAFIMVERPIFGVIQWDTIQDFAKSRSKNVAEEEEADIDDTEGIATENAAMGAP